MAKSLAQQMVEKLESLLLNNPGASEIEVDGQKVKYVDLVQRYEYWVRKYNKEKGLFSNIRRLDLGGDSGWQRTRKKIKVQSQRESLI